MNGWTCERLCGLAWRGAAVLALVTLLAAPSEAVAPLTNDDLFAAGGIWQVHLTFTAAQWAAIEPQDGAAAGRPDPLGSALVAQGDVDSDGRLSRDEWLLLGSRLRNGFGRPQSAHLDREALRSVLSRILFPATGAGPAREPVPPPGPPRLRFEYVRGDLRLDGRSLPDVAVRYKGNNSYMESRDSIGRPMKIDLDSGHPGRSLGGVTKLNLNNNVTDASRMREVLSYEVFRAAGCPTPRTAYALVRLTVPGRHEDRSLGLYTVVENVDRDFLQSRFGTRTGALFKPETQRLFEDTGGGWTAQQAQYVAKTEVDAESAARVMALSRLVSSASDAEFEAELAGYLEIDEFARFMAATVWLSSMDSLLGMGHNFYVFLHPATRRFLFLPWDLDHSFGAFGPAEELQQLSLARPWRGRSLFLERVFRVAAFRERYEAELRRLNEGFCSQGNLERRIAALETQLRPIVRQESPEKRALFEASLRAQPLPPAVGRARAEPMPSIEGQPSAGRPGLPPRAPERRGRSRGSGRRSAQPSDLRSLPEPPPRPPTASLRQFVRARTRAVERQLRPGLWTSATSEPPALAGAGLDPAAIAGHGAPPFGPPGEFDPAALLASGLLAALDVDHSGELSEAEVSRGFAAWFVEWDADRDGALSRAELGDGLASALPFRPGVRPPFEGPPPGALPASAPQRGNRQP